MERSVRFAQTITKLEPLEFIGIARLLKVQLLQNGNEAARPFFEVYKDILTKYGELSNTRQKELLDVARKAIKGHHKQKNWRNSKGSISELLEPKEANKASGRTEDTPAAD